MLREIELFDPSPVALPAAILGLLLLMVTSRWLLRARAGEDSAPIAKRRYGAEFVIPEGSPLAGKTLETAGLASPVGFDIVHLIRADGSRAGLHADTRLATGDVLVLSVGLDALGDLWTMQGLTPLHSMRPMETERFEHQLVEAAVAPDSRVVGRRVSEFPLPDSPYQITLVALSRHDRPVEGRLQDVRVEVGDVAVLEVDESFFYVNSQEAELSLVQRVAGFRIRRWHRAAVAAVITAAMITAAATGWLTMLNAALLASGLMLLTGCMTLRAAARSIDYGTLGVLAAAIGVAAAVSESGLADVIASALTRIGAGVPLAALAAVFLGRVVMANLITNAASAVFMFPIALSMADQLGVSFMPFAIALMTGTIGSAITPAAYQTNLMVYEPGGYAFMDFVKMGVPLTLLVGAVTLLLAPVVFPF